MDGTEAHRPKRRTRPLASEHVTVSTPAPPFFSNHTSMAANIFKSAICRTNTSGIYRPAPSLFFFPGLKARPWWRARDLPVARILEENFPAIREEYLALEEETQNGYKLKADAASDYAMKKSEHALHQGDWDWVSYISKGVKQDRFRSLCPRTAEALDEAHSLMCSTPFDYTFFSVLGAGASIAAHHAPCNLRIRCHLPIIVPEEPSLQSPSSSPDRGAGRPKCGMRVGGEARPWVEGKCSVFDDSFEHEVWNDTTKRRVVLLVDSWHPELDPREINALSEMFSSARKQGLFSS
jgi:aspartate beta-hydroxylase